MAKISYFSNETQVSSNNVLSEIFDILTVDNQMVTSCGQDEPHTDADYWTDLPASLKSEHKVES